MLCRLRPDCRCYGPLRDSGQLHVCVLKWLKLQCDVVYLFSDALPTSLDLFLYVCRSRRVVCRSAVPCLLCQVRVTFPACRLLRCRVSISSTFSLPRDERYDWLKPSWHVSAVPSIALIARCRPEICTITRSPRPLVLQASSCCTVARNRPPDGPPSPLTEAILA